MRDPLLERVRTIIGKSRESLRGGLVLKAHRRLYHSTQGSRASLRSCIESNKEEEEEEGWGAPSRGLLRLGQAHLHPWPGFGVWGVGCGVWGLGVGGWGLGLGVGGLGVRV